MSRFSLIEEKWIPVRFPSGNRDELNLSDTLLRAGEISAIEDSSPLVVAALHRFLLAVLYRSLEGPTDFDQARALFQNGFQGEKIAAYLEKWRDRFHLHDEKHPFGQNPNVPKDAAEPWTKLTAEYNPTSNKVLFDHTDMRNAGARDAKECARWLLSTMTFSISGGRGYYPSPSSNAMLCIPLGRNLRDTLCYNLVPYQNQEVMNGDSALWEREPEPLPLASPKRAAAGYADLYTWQPRMVLLGEDPSGRVYTTRFVAGRGFENEQGNPDPMSPCRIDKARGRMAVRFREDRETWRDFDSLLPDGADLAPLTIQNAVRLAGRRVDRMPVAVLVLGLKYEPPNANVDFWRMERFALPESLAGDRSVRAEIRGLLADAEEAQKALWLACRSFARDLVSHGKRDPAGKDLSGFLGQVPASAWYWSTLESRFHEILPLCTLERDPEEIRRRWLKVVRETLRAAWDQHRAQVSSGGAWTVRALVKAEGAVLSKLKELKEEIGKLESPEKQEDDA